VIKFFAAIPDILSRAVLLARAGSDLVSQVSDTTEWYINAANYP